MPQMRDASPSLNEEGETVTDIADLSRRIARLEAALAAQNLMGRYELYHSAYRKDLIAPLFTARADTVIETPFGTYRGVTAAERAFASAGPQDAPAPDLTGNYVEHVLSTPVIEVSADATRVRATWVSPGAEAHRVGWNGGELTAFWMWGRYAVEVVEEDGQWRFLEFHFTPTFASDYYRSFVDGQIPAPPPRRGPNAPDEIQTTEAYSAAFDPRSMTLGPEPFRD